MCNLIDFLFFQSRAASVKNATEGTFSAKNPSAALQTHADAVLYLDRDSASLLKSELSRNSQSELSQTSGSAKAPAPGAAAVPAKPAGRGFMLRSFRKACSGPPHQLF